MVDETNDNIDNIDNEVNIEDIIDNDNITEGEEDDKESTFKQEKKGSEKSSHKIYKKHSLKYDTIFKGKKETLNEDEFDEFDCMLGSDKIEILNGTMMYEESRNPEQYLRLKNLTEKVYDVLLNQTELNFKKNRRKPSPKDFNRYFEILKKYTKDSSFSDCELFVELAFYFSENLFNMFKLLDPSKGSIIMDELKEYMNKKNGSDLEELDFI